MTRLKIETRHILKFRAKYNYVTDLKLQMQLCFVTTIHNAANYCPFMYISC